MADQLQLLGGRQQRQLLGGARPGGDALGGQVLQNGADAGVGVLHIVHRVLAVLLHGQVQIEVNAGVGLVGVEQEPGGVHGHLVQQRHQGDGLAAALTGLDDFPVPHQAHHLHQHHLELVRVHTQGGEGPLQPGHIAVVVRAQHVDGQVKAPGDQLVVVVGDVRHHVGGHAVAAHQHKVLAAVGLPVEPGGAVLLVGGALLLQQLHHTAHRAVFVEGALLKPVVVLHPVPGQVVVKALDVLGQGVGHQGGPALLAGGFHILVAVFLGKALGVGDDVLALVAVLGEGHGLLALVQLQVPGLQRGAELVHLVARVVDVELPLHLVAGGLQHRGQSVAQHAAPGVADVHGPGGVGGDELHQHPLALPGVRGAIGSPQRMDVLEHLAVEAGVVGKVQKARPGNLARGEIGGGQIQVFLDGLGDFLGGHAEGAGPGHSGVAGPVAVRAVGGDLQLDFRQGGLGQLAGVDGRLDGLGQSLAQLGGGGADKFRHESSSFRKNWDRLG